MNQRIIGSILAGIIVVVSLFVMVSLLGAQSRRPVDPRFNPRADISTLAPNFYRVIDHELGVACYYREFRETLQCIALPPYNRR